MTGRFARALFRSGLLAVLAVSAADAAVPAAPARIAAARRTVDSAELTRLRTAAPLGRLTSAQRPAGLRIATETAVVDSTTSALAVLNGRLGLASETTSMNLVMKPIVRESDGRLRYTVVETIPNSQSYKEYSMYWRPSETGLEVLADSGVAGALAIGFRCAPNIKCMELVSSFHVNSVSTQETARTKYELAGYFYVAAAPSAANAIFNALDVAYKFLQTQP